MPLGWYLAQGLIPVGPSSSDDEEGPCELPNGRVVCGPHGLVYCARCCVDYSFMESNDSEDEDDDDDDDEDDDDEDDDDEDDDDDDSENKDQEDDSSRSRVETASSGPTSNPPVLSRLMFPFFLGPISRSNLMGRDLRRGTGRAFATKFVSSSSSVAPSELFSGRRNHGQVTRYTLPNDPGKGLIYTDGACLNNGQQNPRAGYGFWHGLGPSGNRLLVSARLEQKGPFGDDGLQTSNRAELRAVIAALRFRHWPGEGFHTLVFATDSEYVVEGSTKWAKTWIKHGWVRREGGPVKNKDLWEALLGEVERFKETGMAVQFWRIPRDWNTVADAAAKEGAAEKDSPGQWAETIGMNF